MRRQSPAPDRRRDDLLDAGARVFRAAGVEGATVAAIAKEAGTAKGNFYRYFASKDELLAELKRRFLDDVVADVARFASRAGTPDWGDLIDGFVAQMVDSLLARADLVWVLAAEPRTAESIDLFRRTEERIEAVIVDGIRAGTEAGVFEVEDAEMTAALLQHALSSTVEHAIVYGGVAADRDRLVRAIQAMTRRALGFSPRPARRRRATAPS